MELRSYWAILKRRWPAPVLIPLLVALFSAVQLRPWQAPAPSYSVTMRMLVGVLPLENADGAQYDPRYYAWMTSEYLVDDFTEVLTTQIFAQAINARLTENGLSIPSGLIQGQANTGQRHRIIRLSFTWHDPAELQAIADATVAELEENAAAYFSQLGTESAGISLLDSPTVAPGRTERSPAAGMASAHSAGPRGRRRSGLLARISGRNGAAASGLGGNRYRGSHHSS